MEIQVTESLEPLASEWEALAERTGAPPFLRPGWFAAWWDAFGHGRLRVVAVREAGRLAAVAPFARRGRRLFALANVHSPAFSPVAESEQAERVLVEALVAGGHRQLAVCSLDAASRISRLLDTCGARTRGRVLWTPVQRSPVLPLPSGFAELESRLARKFVHDLQRRRRALERCGRVAFDVEDGTARLDELLDETFRVEASGWKSKRGTAIASRADTRRFYTGVAQWAAGAGFLRLAFLRVDGRAVACQFALEDARSWWFLKGGVDPAFRRFAPGKLLVHSSIERACDRGLATFEFLGADEPWKRDWRPEIREIGLQHVFSGSALGAAERAVVAFYRRQALPLARWTLARAR